jgi:hypothetical protein
MGFFQSSFRARLTVRRRTAVFAVGRRVYVAASRERPTHVALTDLRSTQSTVSAPTEPPPSATSSGPLRAEGSGDSGRLFGKRRIDD